MQLLVWVQLYQIKEYTSQLKNRRNDVKKIKGIIEAN